MDWQKIRKEYKKLKCPKEVWNPLTLPLGECGYYIVLSDRSRGKTTNALLLGMVMNKIDGSKIEYVRQRREQIMPKFILSLFSTIIQYGYVEKITNGEYNTIRNKSRRGYYAHVNENGEMDRIATEPFIHFAGIDECMDLKSTYNSPDSNIIIFDEFISKIYYRDECIDFLDMVSTYFRMRTNGVVMLLANTIDKNSPYFDELSLRDTIDKMHMGENEIVTTSLGTKIYLEILGTVANSQKRLVNKWFFGFKNPKLASITGTESWALPEFQHIPKNSKTEIIRRGIFIYHAGKYVALDIVLNDKIGYCVYAHPATIIHEDSIIYTSGNIPDVRYKYRFGDMTFDKLSKLIWGKMYNRNLFFFSDNSTGALVESYVSLCKKLIKK